MTAPTYRTRPRTVKAMKYTPSDFTQCEAIHAWLGISHDVEDHSPDTTLTVAGHEGRLLTINPGDWVVRDGVLLSILSDQEFASTYEPDGGDER